MDGAALVDAAEEGSSSLAEFPADSVEFLPVFMRIFRCNVSLFPLTDMFLFFRFTACLL